MEKKSKKQTFIGTQFNKKLVIPPTRINAHIYKPTYVDVDVSPSAQKIIDTFKTNTKEDLIRNYEGYIFMKKGNLKVNRYSNPLTINRNDYDDLKLKTKSLQQEERAKTQILNKQGREFYMRELCNLDKYRTKRPVSLKMNDNPEELRYNEAVKELSMINKKLMIFEECPEMRDFNQNAAACQVHAIQGLQIYQTKALKTLECPEDKNDKHLSAIKSDGTQIFEDGSVKQDENINKLNLLLLLKCQLTERDLLNKIRWENKQSAARQATQMDFDKSVLTLENEKKVEKNRELFRKDLKNMINYNKDLTRYKAMENKLIRKRETDYLVAKAQASSKFEKKTKQTTNDYSAHFQKVFEHTKALMDLKAIKDDQYKEWVVWDTQKRREMLNEKNEEKLLRRKLVLIEREFLQSVKDQRKKEHRQEELNEYNKNLRWLEFNDKLESAEPLSRDLLKDTVKYVVLDQINDNEMRQLGSQDRKLYEGTLLKNYQQAYLNLVKARQRQRIDELKRDGMPMPYIGHLIRKFELEE